MLSASVGHQYFLKVTSLRIIGIFLKAQSVFFFLRTAVFIPLDLKESLRHLELVILNDSPYVIILCWGHPCYTVMWLYLFFLFNLLLLFFSLPSHMAFAVSSTSSPHWAGRGSIRLILKDFAVWPSCIFLWWHSLDYVNPKEKAAGVNKNEKELNNFLNGLFRNNCPF